MSDVLSAAAPPALPADDARPTPLRVALAAVRPRTLAVGAAPVALGAALAAERGVFAPLPVLAALAGALLLQVGTNLHNDQADFRRGADTGDRLGPARVTQRGWARPETVRRAALLTFGLAFLPGAYLVWAGGWPILAIGVLGVLCGLAYSGGPAPLAYVGLGEVTVFLFFGLAAVGGTVWVQARAVDAAVLWAGAAQGLLGAAVLLVNNVRDRETDARAGKRTLAVRLGDRAGRALYAACVLGPFAATAGVTLSGLGSRGWLAPLLALPLGLLLVRGVLRAQGRDLNPYLGRTAGLQLAFALLLAAGVLL